MRGANITQETLFTTAELDDFVLDDHSLRAIHDTHASTSDPDSRLFRKGNTGAQLSYQGHVLMGIPPIFSRR